MKVCQNCGIEISTKDGENLCTECKNRNSRKHRASARRRRRERDDVMESLGLVKVRGALGGTYWE